MNVLTRRRYWGLAALAAAACAAIGVSQATSSAATNITLTEEDYFNTPGQVAALNLYSKQFEAAHPGVTIKRQYVPFASLNTKLLTQAAGHAWPGGPASATFTDPTGPDATTISYDFFVAHPRP